MSQAVVVFSFPEPKDSISLGLIIEAAKKSFANMEDVKIHMAVNGPAQEVVAIFKPLHDEESNLVKHARRELDLIENDEEFKKSILAAVRGFSLYGHSGGSAEVAVSIIHELLQFNNLASLTDNPNEWVFHPGAGFPVPEDGCWKSTRRSDAFSKDGGKTYYLLSDGSDIKQQTKIYKSEKRKKD